MGESQSKSYWQKDEEAPSCNICAVPFTLTRRRHHCRNCGFVFCKYCSSHTSPIAMRGIQKPVRVCDPCFSALVVGGRGTAAGAAAPAVGAAAGATSDSAAPQPERAGGAAAEAATPREGDAPSGDAPPPAHLQTAAGSAVVSEGQQPPSPSSHAEAAQGEEEDYYTDAYGAGAAGGGLSAAQDAPQQQQQQQRLSPQSPSHAAGAGNMTQEQLEREQLSHIWATVRQETQFVDILVQRAERVDPTSMVAYSRETEAITLQPEVSLQVLGSDVLPLPRPAENSARCLMEPVKPWTRNNSKHLFALGAIAASIGPTLQPPVPRDSVRRACPSQYAESTLTVAPPA